MRSALGPIASAAECANGVFFEPSYDPTRREVTFRQSPSEERLEPNTTYQLTVFPPVDDESPAGFRAFDGAALARPFVYQFSTVSADPMGATLEAAPKGDLFCKAEDCTNQCAASKSVKTCQAACPASCNAVCMCDPMATECKNSCPDGDTACDMACNTCLSCAPSCLSACTTSCPTSVVTSFSACAFGGCHYDDIDTSTGLVRLGAAAGLNLANVDGIAMTAINRVARQTQQGENADEPDTSPLRFGRAMPVIDASTPGGAGNPGNSYLLYKLAVGKSATGEAAVDPAEIERLRASVVVGMPMPIAPGAALRDVDLEAISAWIAQGAPMRACQ